MSDREAKPIWSQAGLFCDDFWTWDCNHRSYEANAHFHLIKKNTNILFLIGDFKRDKQSPRPVSSLFLDKYFRSARNQNIK